MNSTTFHQGHGGDKKKPRAAHTRRKRDTVLVELCLREFSFIVFVILLPAYFLLYDMPPEFSIQRRLAAIRGLDTTPLAPLDNGSASISSAFDLTMHVSNRRATGRCYRDGGEALVSYAGFTIATARLPGFCVPGKGAQEIQFLAAADGVGLPEHVRDRMALEQRVGATLLDVEVKLFRSDDGSDRPTWMWCGLRMSDGTPRPPNVTPCTVLGLQNWFSVNLN